MISSTAEVLHQSVEAVSSPSFHALAVAPIPQDRPRIITSYFESIPSLCNGDGPERGGAFAPRREIREVERDSPVIPVGVPRRILLRKEQFGSVLYNSVSGHVFLNRPATDLLLQGAFVAEEPTVFLAELRARLPETYMLKPTQIVSYKEQLAQALNFPISATLELTYSCHHSCKHCMYSSSPNFPRANELSVDFWVRTIEGMADRGLCDIYFSGGEIIRYGGYSNLISLCDALDLTYLIVSDLAGHADHDFDVLEQARNLRVVMVSLDGHDPEAHNYLRGPGAFEKTLAGIKRLLEAHVPVGIYHMVHSRNLASVPRFIRFANELGIRHIVTGVACPIGRGMSALNHETLNDEQCRDLSRHYLDAIVAGNIEPTHHAWRVLADRYENTGQCENIFSTWRDFAHVGTHRVHLSPTGEIRLCPKLQGTKYSSFGNLRDTAIEDAWRSPKINALRSKAEMRDLIVGAPYTHFLEKQG